MSLLSEITWVEKTELMDELAEQELVTSPIPAGLEAEVLKLNSSTNCAVLKIWNKESNPDVGFQYHLLQALRSRGVSVSDAYGWGYTASKHKVLVTSYDGSPMTTISERNAVDFALLLFQLHETPIIQLDPGLQKKYDFVSYFFPRLNEHKDIQSELLRLVEQSNLAQSKFIHGDFHLGNILLDHETYTIIDWTNAQLGDARYDLAWSSFLIRIYNGEELASIFLDSYLSKSSFHIAEIQRFEAIACLRGLLLNRVVNLPKNEKTIERVNDYIMSNIYLSNELMIE